MREIIENIETGEWFAVIRDGENEGWRGYLRLRDRIGREFWASKRHVAALSRPVDLASRRSGVTTTAT